MADKQAEFKKILIIHFGQLGDVVLGLPVLAAIRSRFAEAKLTLLVGKATVEVARIANVADEYISVDRVAHRDGNKLRAIRDILGLIGDVRSRGFDLVIDLHSLTETNLLGFTAGIPRRLYARRGNRSIDKLSNFRPRPAAFDRGQHATSRYFAVVAPLGITPGEQYKLASSEEDTTRVKERLRDIFATEKPIVGLFPGAGHPSRQWPLENFADLARLIREDHGQPVVFLGPEEAGQQKRIEELFPPDTVIVDGLSLRELIAAVSMLTAFVGNDTGPTHLAAATGIPVVLILDKRAPLTYLPISPQLATVRDEVIDRISLKSVYKAVHTALQSSRNDKASAA